ncbi:MAG TPA: phosphatase PAP2 family protein [Terriglobales bacterium]|nr:phosphatase PAP2 family protein [Terriglobales bacterium]
MYRRLLAVFLLLALPVLAQQSSPQESSPDSSDQSDASLSTDYHPKAIVRNFLTDEYRMWSSPFRVSDYDAHTMEKYGLPFLGASAALIATDTRVTALIPNTGSQTSIWSGRVSQIGAPYTLAAATGTLFLLSKATHEQHLTETGFLSLEALAHSQLIALGIKEIAQRERPIAAVQRQGFWEGGTSFPSGHATGSFAVATVFAYEYGTQHLAVPIIGFSLASVVGASRVSGRRHWVSDVFVGSALGFLEGRYMYKRYHDPNLPGSIVKHYSRLIPAFDIGPGGGTLAWEF